MKTCEPCWHPSGMRFVFRSATGGVARASLDHRLMAVMPPASLQTGGVARVSLATVGSAHWLPTSAADFFLARNHPHGGAVTAISRWSMEPRDRHHRIRIHRTQTTPVGVAAAGVFARGCEAFVAVRCWHPSGMRSVSRPGSGGVARASLDHRLMAGKPPASSSRLIVLASIRGGLAISRHDTSDTSFLRRFWQSFPFQWADTIA